MKNGKFSDEATYFRDRGKLGTPVLAVTGYVVHCYAAASSSNSTSMKLPARTISWYSNRSNGTCENRQTRQSKILPLIFSDEDFRLKPFMCTRSLIACLDGFVLFVEYRAENVMGHHALTLHNVATGNWRVVGIWGHFGQNRRTLADVKLSSQLMVCLAGHR